MPSNKKTPEEDFTRFEKFIDNMQDVEFQYWYSNEATGRQKDLADKVREEVKDDYQNTLDSFGTKYRDSLRQFYMQWLNKQ